MATIPGLAIPGYSQAPDINWTSLSDLGKTLGENRLNNARNEAMSLAKLGDGSLDFNKAAVSLASLGDYQGAQYLKSVGDRQQDLARQGRLDERQLRRDDVTDAQNAAYLKIAQANAARAAEGPEETAAQRAKAARAYGIDPTTPEGRAYVLTGKLPENNTTVQNQTEQRKAAATNLGLTPEHPAYNSYVLTGKMPREDQAPLTATDKKAILEADELVQSTHNVIGNLNEAKKLSAQAYSGPAAGARGYAASFLGPTSDLGKAGIATTDLNNLVTTNALSQLKAIFGGNPTEGERAILLDIQGSANQPDSVRQKIYDRAIQLAQRRLEFNQQKANELRGGQYYKPQGGQSKASAAPQVAAPQGDPLAMARDAIQRGADPEAVRQRLRQNGIDPSGL